MSELAPGSVTTADLYRELVGMRSDIVRALTRIEVIDARNAIVDKDTADHESRLRTLEKFRYTLLGVALVGGTASGYLGFLIGHVTIH